MIPFEKFKQWYREEKTLSELRIPSACCFSTLGLDGYPNARFVSLKELRNETFIITGPLNSRKGLEVAAHSKVSLTFWWTKTERQVRIQGDAFQISDKDAQTYFAARNRDSKIVSTIFEQGQEIESFEKLDRFFESKKEGLKSIAIEKPQAWSGFYIEPIRIEFMDFQKSRLHRRELFEKISDEWINKIIQP